MRLLTHVDNSLEALTIHTFVYSRIWICIRRLLESTTIKSFPLNFLVISHNINMISNSKCAVYLD